MRCKGSEVPGDRYEHGHVIKPGTEALVFTQRQGSYLDNPRRAVVRCRRCASTRDNYRRYHDFTAKANHTLNSHARRMVKDGAAPDRKSARVILDAAGLTTSVVAAILQAALNQPCPGLCGELAPDGTFTRHIMTRPSEIHFDWRDPRYPLTPENCGPLCENCNKQKGPKPWPEHMAYQRAMLANLEATPLPPPPVQEELPFW